MAKEGKEPAPASQTAASEYIHVASMLISIRSWGWWPCGLQPTCCTKSTINILPEVSSCSLECPNMLGPNRSLLLGLAASQPQPLPDLGFVSISWSHRHCIHNGTFWGGNTSSVKERQVPDRTTARTRGREIHVPFRETEGGSESFGLVTVWLSYGSKSGSQGFTPI